jgi:hypothetical protein
LSHGLFPPDDIYLDQEATLICYLQKFSDDQLMALIRNRMSDKDLEELFNLIGRLIKKYLTEEKYHTYFLKEET